MHSQTCVNAGARQIDKTGHAQKLVWRRDANVLVARVEVALALPTPNSGELGRQRGQVDWVTIPADDVHGASVDEMWHLQRIGG